MTISSSSQPSHHHHHRWMKTFWSPVEKLLSLLMTFNSRTNEFAADRYAVSLHMGKELASGLIKISVGRYIDR